MKKILFIAVLLFVAIIARSQDDKWQKNTKDLLIDGPVDQGQKSQKDGARYTITKRNDTVYYAVEFEPLYPGGIAAFVNYVNNNFNQNALNGQQLPPREIVTFIVKKDGSLADTKILRGVSAAIDSETVRIVRKSPQWRPGMQNGKVYDVQYTVPIRLHTPTTFIAPAYSTKIDTLTTLSLPHFRGGKEAYYKFLAENLQWPNPGKDLHGAVYLAFIVEEDGSLKNIHVVRGLSPELNNEALRVIRLSTPWVPAKVNHKAVRYYYHMHISYRIND